MAIAPAWGYSRLPSATARCGLRRPACWLCKSAPANTVTCATSWSITVTRVRRPWPATGSAPTMPTYAALAITNKNTERENDDDAHHTGATAHTETGRNGRRPGRTDGPAQHGRLKLRGARSAPD